MSKSISILPQDHETLEQFQIEVQHNDQPDLVNSRQSGAVRPVNQTTEVKSLYASHCLHLLVQSVHVLVLVSHSTTDFRALQHPLLKW